MIKMGRYNYAFQNFDATKHVRASIREKKISHKHARETAKAIKGLTLEKARDYMLSVIAKESKSKRKRKQTEARGPPPQAISKGRGPPQAISKGRGQPPQQKQAK